MATETHALTGKELLLNVARDLFSAHGYNGVSIQQIADAAHMTKGSPYYHFKNKEDLFTQVFVREIRGFLDGIHQVIEGDGSFEERIYQSFRYVLVHGDEGLNRLSDDFDRYILPHRDPNETEIEGITAASVVHIFDPLMREAESLGLKLRFPFERASVFLLMIVTGQNEIERMQGRTKIPIADIDAYAEELTSFVLHG